MTCAYVVYCQTRMKSVTLRGELCQLFSISSPTLIALKTKSLYFGHLFFYPFSYKIRLMEVAYSIYELNSILDSSTKQT